MRTSCILFMGLYRASQPVLHWLAHLLGSPGLHVDALDLYEVPELVIGPVQLQACLVSADLMC